VERTHDALDGLEVDTAAMRANLDRSHGLIMAEALTMALAPQVGRPEAFRLVRTATERARTTGAELRDVALADAAISAALSAEAITQAFDPAGYLGSADHFIDRALADYRALLAAGV
jgi:3-carboxy-cis,cis-muconate cycloisomerase